MKQTTERRNIQLDEQDLVDRLKKGQEWAVNTLVKTYQGMLLKIAYSITLEREESLEIVQDVFVSACRNIGGFRQDSSLAGWLRKITINMCLNWKRKWKRRFRWSHQPIEPGDDHWFGRADRTDDTPEDEYREKEFHDMITQKISRLPEKIRVVFVLNAVEGMSYDEIAGHLNLKPGTVKSRLFHARKRLMESLDE